MAENSEKHDVTELLIAWNNGKKEVVEELFPLVYRELKKIAKRYFRRERDDHTLQTTALVHEAYFKLIDQTRVKWQNRSHFFGIAAQAMRRILLEHARQHIADKRGSGNEKISLDAEEIDVSSERAAELIMLDEALKKLESIDPERSKIVELRYFGGLSIEETAQVLGIGTATVNRSWRVAKAWLYKELAP